MNEPDGIIVFGANGSGKTTLGRELARILGFIHIDLEAYAFNKSEIPFTNPRSKEECMELMLADIEKHRSFVLSSVIGDFGEVIPQYYRLAVWITAPLELRLERIRQRDRDKYGDRVLKDGDMYEQQLKFVDFVANRSMSRIDNWAKTLTCPIIHIDGTKDWRSAAENIAERYGKR